MLLTLIQTSQNRKEELRRFILSLNSQVGIDFYKVQLIFVDQGDNQRVFDQLIPEIVFTYLQSPPCSLSHARNLAIPYVKGKYVAFPDDDCWYEPNTLQLALKVMEKEGYDGVSGKGTNEKGKLTSLFPVHTDEIIPTKRCAAISYTMFFRFEPSVLFDENMGVGSPYNIGAGEETDYLLTLLKRYGYRIKYESTLIIHHPIQANTDKVTLMKAYSYARGAGYLMQKHRFPLLYYVKQFLRPLGGLVLYLLKGNTFNARKSFYIFKGRVEGYFFKLPICQH